MITLEDFLADENYLLQSKTGLSYLYWYKLSIENYNTVFEVDDVVIPLSGHGEWRKIVDIDDIYIYAKFYGGGDNVTCYTKKLAYRDIVKAKHKTKIDLSSFNNDFYRMIYFIRNN